jgi:hypothetical protein
VNYSEENLWVCHCVFFERNTTSLNHSSFSILHHISPLSIVTIDAIWVGDSSFGKNMHGIQLRLDLGMIKDWKFSRKNPRCWLQLGLKCCDKCCSKESVKIRVGDWNRVEDLVLAQGIVEGSRKHLGINLGQRSRSKSGKVIVKDWRLCLIFVLCIPNSCIKLF